MLHYVSLLMQYPEIWKPHKHDIKQFIIEEKLSEENNVCVFLAYFDKISTNEANEQYVMTFDFNEELNFYLTYHRYKDDKERGQQMIKLKETFQKAGLECITEELPDYLPLVLEFLAHADEEIIIDMYTEYRPAIVRMRDVLAQQNGFAKRYSLLMDETINILDKKCKKYM